MDSIESARDRFHSVVSDRLQVRVLYTEHAATASALQAAAELTAGLDADIRVLAMQTVPYPLPLNRPPVDARTWDQRLRDLQESSPGACSQLELCCCRDPWETLRAMLSTDVIVVIAKRTRWWPTAEDALARKLSAAGFHVIRTAARKDTPHA